MSTILLEIVTPERLLLSQEATIVNVVGTEGAMGILPGHAHLLAALAIDPLRWQTEDGEEHRAAICGGFMEVTPSKVSILAESAELAGEIDKSRCEAAAKRAQERIKEAGSGAVEIDTARAERSLQRAVTRLKVLD